jgi:hypothetical protein
MADVRKLEGLSCPARRQGWVLGSFLQCVDAVVEAAMQTRRAVLGSNWELHPQSLSCRTWLGAGRLRSTDVQHPAEEMAADQMHSAVLLCGPGITAGASGPLGDGFRRRPPDRAMMAVTGETRWG